MKPLLPQADWNARTEFHRRQESAAGQIGSFSDGCGVVAAMLDYVETEVGQLREYDLGEQAHEFHAYFTAVFDALDAVDTRIRDLIRMGVLRDDVEVTANTRVAEFIQRCGPFLDGAAKRRIIAAMLAYVHSSIMTALLDLVPARTANHRQLLVAATSVYAFDNPALVITLPRHHRDSLIHFSGVPFEIDTRKRILNYAETQPTIVDIAQAFQHFFTDLGAAIAAAPADLDGFMRATAEAIGAARTFFTDSRIDALPQEDYYRFTRSCNFASILAAVKEYPVDFPSSAWTVFQAPDRLYAVQLPHYSSPFAREASLEEHYAFRNGFMEFALAHEGEISESRFLRHLDDLEVRLRDIRFELLPADRAQRLTRSLLAAYFAASSASAAMRARIEQRMNRDPVAAVELAAIAYVIFESLGLPHAEQHALADALIWFLEPSVARRVSRASNDSTGTE